MSQSREINAKLVKNSLTLRSSNVSDAIIAIKTMNPVYQGKYFLSAGDANAEGRLSLTMLTTKIIDVATEHANALGIGNPMMAHLNAGWILSRLTLEMKNYPVVNNQYVLKTWIEDFNRHFSTRCFSIESPEGEIYGYARTVWLVMDAVNHTNYGTSHLSLPPEAIVGEGVPISKQEKHVSILPADFEGDINTRQIIATHKPYHYTFKFCDIDFYRHVNTVRYIALLLNQFTLSEHDETLIERMELSFLHEASYGMHTTLLRADSKDTEMESSFQLSDDADNKALLFARIKRRFNTPER